VVYSLRFVFLLKKKWNCFYIYAKVAKVFKTIERGNNENG